MRQEAASQITLTRQCLTQSHVPLQACSAQFLNQIGIGFYLTLLSVLSDVIVFGPRGGGLVQQLHAEVADERERFIGRNNFVAKRDNQNPCFSSFVTESEVQGQYLLAEVHSRRAVELRH